ncbi:MAG TPA: molybdopterin cofactor-binding domain-containing protein [Spirochaetia bacterium]|nr:molybdopterin cofactor-binding domain-containing protein [Spirochaetia bacterium]
MKMGYREIGRRLPRHDALLQVTGRAVYGDDLARPGMLFAKALRGAYAHAAVIRLDTSAAEAAPGVRAVITAKDVPHNVFGFSHLDQPVLAADKVRYRGDALAVVAAESREAAEEAVKLIKVVYEPLAAVFDPVEAMQPGAPKIHGETNVAAHIKIRSGDLAEGWREADEIVEENFRTPMVEHAHIEPHAAVAEVSPGGELTVWSSVQRPFLIAADLGSILQKPLNTIRVIATAVGGGFGGKNEVTIEPLVSLLALRTGRPVKMVFSREEEFQASTVRHPYIIKFRSGVKRDGTLTARQVEIVSDCGAYVSWGQSTLSKAAIHAAGPYRIPHVWVDGFLVYTNNNVGGAMRGFGVPQLGFAYEVHTDTIAAALGMDPVAFRLRNVITDDAALPTGQVLETVTVTETMQRAMEIAGWEGR